MFNPPQFPLPLSATTTTYTCLVPLPNSTAVSNMVPDLATAGLVTAPVITSPLVPSPTAPTQDDDRVVTYGIVYGGGEWFPTLQKCLYILGKMYRALPVRSSLSFFL